MVVDHVYSVFGVCVIACWDLRWDKKMLKDYLTIVKNSFYFVSLCCMQGRIKQSFYLKKDLLGSNDKIYPATPTYNSFLIAKIESLVIRKLNHFDEQYIKTGNLWEYQDVSCQEQQSMRDTRGGMSLSAGSLAEKCMRLNNSSLLELWSNFGNVSHNIAALEKREKSWFTSLPKTHPEPSRYLTRREVSLAGAKKHKPLWVLGFGKELITDKIKVHQVWCAVHAYCPVTSEIRWVQWHKSAEDFSLFSWL